jgi:hypothetical protein
MDRNIHYISFWVWNMYNLNEKNPTKLHKSQIKTGRKHPT